MTEERPIEETNPPEEGDTDGIPPEEGEGQPPADEPKENPDD